MNAIARILLTLSLPIVAVLAVVLAVLVIAVDLLVLPLVLLTRQGPRDDQPASRNASIIVLNYNGIDFLRELMPSLRAAVDRCPGDHEVIVVDNGSDDGSVAWLETDHSWAKLVTLPENLHFIRGNAAGAKTATRDLIVYLNNDMRVEEDFLVELLRPFEEDTSGQLFASSARIEMQGQRSETDRKPVEEVASGHIEGVVVAWVHCAGDGGLDYEEGWFRGRDVVPEAQQSEAEWERAARANTQTAFSTGEITDISCADLTLNIAAWYCATSGSFSPCWSEFPYNTL